MDSGFAFAPRNDDTENHSRDASASEFCSPPRRRRYFEMAPSIERGKAKRRKAHSATAVLCEARQRIQRDALAFRRFTAALVIASERLDSAQAALRAKHDAEALPPLWIALKRSTSRAGHHAGGVDARTARERGYKPRPQEPHSLHQLAVTGQRP